MNTVFKIYQSGIWKEYTAYNLATLDERLDEQLDTGSVQVITDSADPIAAMSICELSIKESENTVSMPAYCFDTVEVRGTDYCIHNLTLCEPTRRFMGILIDGLKITQPKDGTNKKNLKQVAERLLKTYALRRTADSDIFTFTTDTKILALLESVDSPEFEWEAETLLWECLKDIGDVINCMPRLTFNAQKTDFTVITFDEINEPSGEYEL